MVLYKISKELHDGVIIARNINNDFSIIVATLKKNGKQIKEWFRTIEIDPSIMIK